MPQTTGYQPHIHATLQQLKSNLRDNYNEPAIVSEWLQNADDSQATTLDIAYLPDLPGADHVLLQGPLLLVLNDGAFGAKDADAISRFGLSSKSADAQSIGKFGLGLKSVFHLCEAF